MANDPDVIKLHVTNDLPGEGNLMLRMSPEIAEEIRALLDENELEHAAAAEFSAGPELILETVKVVGLAIGAAGGLNGLAKVFEVFLQRHKDKTVELVPDGSVKITGASLEEADKFLQKQAYRQGEIEADWKEENGS